MIEPGVPPVGVARRVPPEVIPACIEARLWEQCNIQIDCPRLGDIRDRIRPEGILPRLFRENQWIRVSIRPGRREEHPVGTKRLNILEGVRNECWHIRLVIRLQFNPGEKSGTA